MTAYGVATEEELSVPLYESKTQPKTTVMKITMQEELLRSYLRYI